MEKGKYERLTGQNGRSRKGPDLVDFTDLDICPKSDRKQGIDIIQFSF